MKKYTTQANKVQITFYQRKVEDKERSTPGNIVFRMEDWFTYKHTNRSSHCHRRVYSSDKVKYAQAWASYQKMKENTPLTEITQDPDLLEFLKEKGVQSVEQLASYAVNTLGSISENIVPVYNKAKDYIQKRNIVANGAPQQNAEIEKLQRKLELVMNQLPKGTKKVLENELKEEGLD